MLFEILSLLLEVVAGIVGAACLLRLYMQYHRIPMSLSSGNPLARFIFALTDWIVLPLRRVIPAMGRWDLASLLAAWLVQMALVALKFTLWWLLEGMAVRYGSVPVLAVFGVLSLAISGMSGLVIIYAILSWVQARHPLADLIERLVVPALAPIRRFMPLIGGIDLSPLVLLVALQILSIVLGGLQRSVFF